MSVREETSAPPPEVAPASELPPARARRPRRLPKVGAAALATAAVALLYALGPIYADEFLLTFLTDVLLFGLVALGLGAFGAFEFAEAGYRRIDAPDGGEIVAAAKTRAT